MQAKPSILFVTATTSANPYADASVRYRCFHVAQELTRRGARSHVVAQETFTDSFESFANFDRYVLHRPSLTTGLAERLLDLPSGRAVADFDELVFDVQHAHLIPPAQTAQRAPAELRRDVASMAESLSLVSAAIASTTELAGHVKKLRGLDVSVVPSCVDPAFLGLAQELRRLHRDEARPFALAYFADAASTEDPDFALVAPLLAEALARSPHARALIVGPVTLPKDLVPYASRILRVAPVSFHALPYLLAQCGKVLMPRQRNAFSDCKSAVPAIEAMLVGCEVVATKSEDLARLNTSLLRCCETDEAWRVALHQAATPWGAELEQELHELERSARVETALRKLVLALGLEEP